MLYFVHQIKFDHVYLYWHENDVTFGRAAKYTKKNASLFHG